MSYSGQELVEQERCKLVYAQFFEGVQCYDPAKGIIQIATPDFEYNTYDSVTKTLTTKTFSVTPVIPTDLTEVRRPLLYTEVEIQTTGLKVTLTADQYTKTRIIPLYYLTECLSYSWDSDLRICIDVFLNTVVTKVSFETGLVTFINNQIIKYETSDGITKLYRLKDLAGNVISFEIPDYEASTYYLPLAYYIDELPARLEREIVNGYDYGREYTSYDLALYPCTSSLDDEDYYDLDTIINSTFRSSIRHKEATVNDWEFNITIFRDNYTLSANQLQVSILFFNRDTGVYSTKSYSFDFFDKSDNPIDLESAVAQNNPQFTELLQQLGTANCSGYFKIYVDTVYFEDRAIDTYSYPVCESGVYNLEACDCSGISPCASRLVYSCEECDEETGEVTSLCAADEICTVLGCKKDFVVSACVCSGTTYGYQNFPRVQASYDSVTCASEPYEYYVLYKNGDIGAGMGTLPYAPQGPYNTGSQPLPEIRLANIYDYIQGNTYDYAGTQKTVSIWAFLCLQYLGFDETNLEEAMGYDYIILTASHVQAICPSIGSITVDWFTPVWSGGGIRTYGSPCTYTSATVTFDRNGVSWTYYNTIIGGLTFIYPSILNYTAITSDSTIQDAYDTYCEKVKFLGSDQAYTYGRFLDEIPASGTLNITV